jgi:hypothetical protein
MRISTRRHGFLQAALLTACLQPSVALADKAVAEPSKTGGFEDALGGPRWGDTTTGVLSHYEKLAWDEYKQAKKKLPDPLAIDNLRKITQQRIMKTKANLTRFIQGSTAYRVSIIDSEFKVGTDEAVLRIDTAAAQRYLFFVQEKLWKLVVAFNQRQVEGLALASFADRLRGDLGDPLDRKLEQRDGGDALTEVKWADDATEAVLRDRNDPYGTYTLTYTSRDLAGRISELRGELSAFAGGSGPTATDMLLDDIMTAPDEDPEKDIIDELTGVKAQVWSNRPAEEQPPTVGEDAADVAAEDEGGKGDAKKSDTGIIY